VSRRFGLRSGATIAVITASAVAAVGVASVATGTIPSGNGVINACYATGDGQLRVVDREAGETCPKNFTPLEWNQKGIKGDPGTTGPQGPQGPQGRARS
jgi:hypothetical protein